MSGLIPFAFPVKAVRPHLGAIAAKMEEMWKASQLSVSERNVLCDSMLAAAASGSPELRSQVLIPLCQSSKSVRPSGLASAGIHCMVKGTPRCLHPSCSHSIGQIPVLKIIIDSCLAD